MAIKDLNYQKKARTLSKDGLVSTLQAFDPDVPFSVGIWYFSPGGGRFHDRYVPEMDIEERINLLAEMKDIGVNGVEAHYPAEINWDNIDLYKNLEKETGISVVGIPFSHFFDKQFEFGALSNPDPEIRQNAIDIAIEAMKIADELGTPNVISWPGMDGYTYDIGTIYPWMWRYYDDSMAKVLDAFPAKVRVALEPKPYEPAINNIFRTTAEGILAGERIEGMLENDKNRSLLEEGKCLFGLNPE